MIRVAIQPEPEDFDAKVRRLGRKFLLGTPHPTEAEFRNAAYWRKALPNLRAAYRKFCAYSATYIPPATGNHSVDHFLPKSTYPERAYDWDNFRYVSARFNSRKGLQEVVDPFEIDDDWFNLDLETYLIHPNNDLPNDLYDRLSDTIRILKLNDDNDLVEERRTWLTDFFAGEATIGLLEKYQPFLAKEVRRQFPNMYD